MTHFREDATVCVTREQFDEAVRRGDPAPMLYVGVGRQFPADDSTDEVEAPRA